MGDLSAEWAAFQQQSSVLSTAEEQDELQAQATRLINATTAALKQYHDHRRTHGQHAILPSKPLCDLSFWMEVVIADTEC